LSPLDNANRRNGKKKPEARPCVEPQAGGFRIVLSAVLALPSGAFMPMNSRWTRFALALPALTAFAAVVALVIWWTRQGSDGLKVREPFTDLPPGLTATATLNPVQAGKVVKGSGTPANLPGAWPQFRGPNRDGISPETAPLARSWDSSGPRELWGVEVGEGYAGVVVQDGRVYVLDYDREHKQSALRCLSLADGSELWRFTYTLTIKRNHGMTRTVPALAGQRLVALDSKCNVFCLDAASGELRWSMNLVRDYGTEIPQWYAGQCPLIESNSVILAPGGTNALLMAVDLETGKPLWQTPNPHGWKMTHSSIMPMEFGGRRFFVYCASGGVVGVDARDGALLWETNAWKISIATVPSPVPLPEGRVFLTGGYGAGSLMLRLASDGGGLAAQVAFKLPPEVFGATQHTPVFRDGHLFGTRADGQFVCLDLDGKVVWASGSANQFGLGPFLLADGVIFAMNDSGRLSLFDASTTKCTPLAQAQVLKGRESWGPMALVGGRLLVRDLTRLVCLDVSAK
jgi:outer membrane protein assembly factor BamB